MEKKKIGKKLIDPLGLSFLGVLIALGILLWIKLSPQLKEKKNQPWLSDKIESIDKIEIQTNNQKIILIKENNSWQVASEKNLPADKNKIDRLLDSLRQLKKTELVSKNENYHHKFGLNQENAIELKVYQGENNFFSLLVGNAGPDFESDYIRFPQEKEVYLSNIALRSVLIQPQWKNLKVTDFYSDQVEKVIIKKGKRETEFDSEKAKELINQLTGIQAHDAQLGSISRPTTTITIKLKENNKTIVLKLGEKNNKNQRSCQENEEPIIYLLPSWLDEKIDQAVKQLLSTN